MSSVIRIKPDYRLNGKYQFVVGYTHSGAEIARHLSLTEIEELLERTHGKGAISDDGTHIMFIPSRT